jgi:hypothetical protein
MGLLARPYCLSDPAITAIPLVVPLACGTLEALERVDDFKRVGRPVCGA